MKRVMAIVLAAILMLSCSACSKSNANTANTSSQATANLSSEASMKLEDYPSVMKITMYTANGSNLGNKNLQHDWLLKNLKIDMEATFNSGEDVQTKLSTMLASNDMPDVIFTYTSYKSSLQQFVDAGMCLSWDQYESIMPDYMSYLDKSVLDYWQNSSDGKLYMLPGFVKIASRKNELLGDPTVIAYRSDVLAYTGMKAPTTFDELYQFLKTAKEKCPSSSYYKNFIPFSMANGTWDSNYDSMFYVGFGTDPSHYVVDDTNQTLYEAYMSQGWEKAMAFLSKLYREGLMEKSVLTDTETQSVEKAKQGKYGFYIGSISDFGDNIEGALERNKCPGKYVCCPMMTETSTSKNLWNYYSGLGTSCAIVNKNVKDPVRLLKYINWQNTKVGNTVTWWGAPDKTDGYWYIEDGKYYYNTAFFNALMNGTKTSDKCDPWCYWIAGPGVSKAGMINLANNGFLNSPGVREFHQKSRDYGYADAYNDPKIDKYSLADKGTLYKQKYNDLQTIVEKWRAKIISSASSDADALNMYNQMVKQLKAAGVDEVAKECYQVYKKANS